MTADEDMALGRHFSNERRCAALSVLKIAPQSHHHEEERATITHFLSLFYTCVVVVVVVVVGRRRQRRRQRLDEKNQHDERFLVASLARVTDATQT